MVMPNNSDNNPFDGISAESIAIMASASREVGREQIWVNAVTAVLKAGLTADVAVARADYVVAEYDRRTTSKDKRYFGLNKDK